MKINTNTGGNIAETSVAAPFQGLSTGLVLLLAICCGLSVANVYFAQPLLDAIGRDMNIPSSRTGMVISFTQIGYGIGLLLLVPLGDLWDSRKLISTQLALLALFLLIVGFTHSTIILLAAMMGMGLMAVVAQSMVALAANRSTDRDRGTVVGTVTSGIVIGILLARTISGTLSDWSGWRTVYLFSASATLLFSFLLYRQLPSTPPAKATGSYPQLLKSVFTLFFNTPVLLVRGLLAMFIFGAATVLWTPMVFPLSDAPFYMSHSEVGLFGLAGVTGALGAVRAGKLADKGWAQWTSGIGLAVMLLSWIFIYGGIPHLWMLVAGIIVFDFGLQAVHVTNQSIILKIKPEARGRITGGYMIFYSIGSAAGSLSTTNMYAAYGWTGVSLLGASICTMALICWAIARKLNIAG
ncbi:MFS transporter [Pseudoflavitalea sp. G-6-1-2]|uniref:MFS transporter n=1 Tax=Pseudoflavitalea sp. G-6-1-2 TaxID=2728841 RepID=UPI00146E3BC7|nr:MFS transporter [Pseudoflavitalea sp. G-6-1-2]NML21227.1 MFS transporter [Pseudoflavitalea sp. G-6-1-2]